MVVPISKLHKTCLTRKVFQYLYAKNEKLFCAVTGIRLVKTYAKAWSGNVAIRFELLSPKHFSGQTKDKLINWKISGILKLQKRCVGDTPKRKSQEPLLN